MKAVRVLVAALLLLLGALVALIGIAMGTGSDLVGTTIARNHAIEAHLRQSAAFARSFLSTNGRVPTDHDIERWRREDPDSRRGATWFQGPPFEPEALERFGEPPQSAKQPFMVTYWRGEWREYYASWTDTTSLEYDPSKYYVLGNKYAQSAVYALFGTVLIGIAYYLWPRSLPRNDA